MRQEKILTNVLTAIRNKTQIEKLYKNRQHTKRNVQNTEHNKYN